MKKTKGVTKLKVDGMPLLTLVKSGKPQSVIFVVFAVFACFAQSENWNGWGDTANVPGIQGDSAVTYRSGWFKLSAFANVRHACYFDDTSAEGYLSDSVAFIWGIQYGHPSWLTTSSLRKKMEVGSEQVMDTVNTTDTFNFYPGRITLDLNGIPVKDSVNGRIDTLVDSTYSTLSGGTMVRSPLAYQSRGPFNEWDVYFRYWAVPITGCKNTPNIRLIFQAARQAYIKVGN